MKIPLSFTQISHSVTNKLEQYGVNVSVNKPTSQSSTEPAEGRSLHLSVQPRKFKSAMQDKLNRMAAKLSHAPASTTAQGAPSVTAGTQTAAPQATTVAVGSKEAQAAAALAEQKPAVAESTPEQVKTRLQLGSMIRSQASSGARFDEAKFAAMVGELSLEELEKPDATGLNLASTAVLHRNFAAIRALKEKGVDFKAENKNGSSADALQRMEAKQHSVDFTQSFRNADGAVKKQVFTDNLAGLMDPRVVGGSKPLLDTKAYKDEYFSETPELRAADFMVALKSVMDTGFAINAPKHEMKVNQIDSKITDMQLMAFENDPEHVKMMIALGGDLHAKAEGSEDSALHFACKDAPESAQAKENQYLCAETIIASGGDATQLNKNGEQPLFDAAKNGSGKLVQLFLDNHSDINLANERGATPLHAATMSGNLEAMTALLDAGADMTLKTKTGGGLTPLDLAKRLGKDDAVALLESRMPKEEAVAES